MRGREEVLGILPSEIEAYVREVRCQCTSCCGNSISFYSLGKETCDLLDKLLTCNPRERITAAEALDHDYFWTDPLPADPKMWGLAHCSPLIIFIES